MFRTRSVRAGNSSQPLRRGQVPSNLPPHPPPPIPHTFPYVHHAEGGDENQPHNSAHNSASTANRDNNPSDPLINLLNPAPQPPTPQQNPEPVQHAPTISESQGQSHIAPVQQPLHDDVTRRLDSLEKPVVEYLPPRSISYYTEMASAFATKFSNRRLIKKTTFELMRVRQRDEESLKNFMSRFNDAVLEVNSFDQAVGITVVISSLSHERFRDSLLKHPATTFSEVNDRSLKFITAEEYALSQNPVPIKNQHPDWRDENPNRKRMKTTQNRAVISSLSHERFRDSLLKHPATTFSEIKNKMDLRRPGPMKTAPVSRNHTRYCDFHQDHGHTTEQCNSLREQGPPPQGVRNPPNRQVPVEGVLTMNVAFGSGRSYVTPSVRFLVVKMASSFNVVIGRPTLTEIRVVEVARHCYITSVTKPQKGKAQTPKTNPKRIPDDRQVMGVEIVDNRPEDDTRAALVEDVEEVQIDDMDPTRKTQIGTWLSPDERTDLIAFLRANKDVFAWTSTDMMGIPTSVSQHKLSTNPLKKPVAQKRRLFRGERLTIIKEEVEKFLQAGFIRQVDYCEWVANPVLVKKANGKWRMCIDYTNLNQACPKDYYPMPNIDELVEAASGNERLSLLDAYSSYHQVPMAPEDEEKTSFYAGDEIYCYVMMPFGLKNAGAIYQKMVTIVFRAQIGRNLEVYVDDIVVKSLKAGDHLTDLEETFNNLRKNKMRLNPAKCIFGVESGKFLSFMVSKRGIEVNPEKIKAVAEMEPPKSMKDIQRLTRRVAALHRFISKSADKCLPFFKIMRSTAQKDESDEAISSFLVREEAKQQKLIYYISNVLHGAELRYPISEKAALVVVTSAKKLRPYFQSHLIVQKSAIRAQALADFIVECTPHHSTPNPEPNEWTLYVDGASSSKGLRAGALLIGPNGYQSEHAMKFNFDATNNMVEYEALLLGLQLAFELKISAIQVYSDSQLVVNQINSICEVVDTVMMKYVTLVAELKCRFQRFYLSKIPRTENEQADSLSKFASDSSLSSRSIFVEDGVIPEDKQEAMKLRKKASRYTLVDGVLYKRSFSLPLLRCLNPYEAEYALREVHEGVCGSHIGARTLAHKVLRQGYYWPNIYGIPNQIVADNGTQFNCSSFRDFCSNYGIKLQFTSVYHPESNGMVESVNKSILEGETPYHLAFGTEAVIPIEIAVPSFRVTHFDEGRNGQLLREHLDLLDEAREEARL
ncbi:hypothetical protein SLEP1_g22348 [Rubroshorea leprosula]|uniref:Uncharacterized protein n=1 Tax=Rubroshorea leprosula TaxID=152421 RepID=A0AAV5JI90_9ROSI|nr:hypothetical protein SLEP1_g22348 [Rubroshorea leprosula]